MQELDDIHSLSDDELLQRVSELLSGSRRIEADLVAHLAEVDARRLYAREAAPSMFAYATQVLHLSEHEAFLRISVARASRHHPVLLEMLRDGRLHLSAIAKLAPHLTPGNRDALLARAVHRTKREVEELVAQLAPRPEAASVIRKLPQRTFPAPSAPRLDRVAPAPQAGQHSTPERPLRLLGPDQVAPSTTPLAPRPATVQPVAPARYRVHFDASAELRDKLERLQALMRTSVPDGDLAQIIDAAVSEKLDRLEARRYGRTKKPRKTLAETDPTPTSRDVPAAVKRAVDERDGHRCVYRDTGGRRCTETRVLEYHHSFPFAAGSDHHPDGVALSCNAHNRLMAEQDFGKERIERYQRPRAPV